MTIWPTKKLGEIFAPIFKGVEQSTLERINREDIREEDHITSTVFTLLEEKINGENFEGLAVRAHQFPGRGPNSTESITGADGAIILNIRSKDIDFRKCYIFQAKNSLDGSFRFNKLDIIQKDKMLHFSPDSFFLVYTKINFQFISAFLVSLKDKPDQLPVKTFWKFHKDFFNCFIGDHFFAKKFNEKNLLAKKNLLIELNQTSNL